MQNALAYLLLALASPSVFAKCANEIITVSGKATTGAGTAVPGAVVAVSWSSQKLPQGPVFSAPDAQGTFRVEFRFNTFTKFSWLRGDVCRERINRVSVSAYAPGYRSEPVVVPVRSQGAQAALLLESFAE